LGIEAKHYRVGRHPNSLAALRPAAKGEVRNPNGRPKLDCSITSAVKAELDSVPPIFEGEPNQLTWRQLIRDAWLLRAARGDAGALATLLERVEGRVTLPLSTPEPLEVRFVTISALT